MSKTIELNEKKVFIDFTKLSKERKKEVANFIAYLKIKEELEVTKDIIKDEDFLKSIIKGDTDFKTGKFKKWDEVKDNV